MSNIDEHCRAIGYVFLYVSNKRADEVISAVYGDDISDVYRAEKLNVLMDSGIGALWAMLDTDHRRKLVTLACEKYAPWVAS